MCQQAVLFPALLLSIAVVVVSSIGVPPIVSNLKPEVLNKFRDFADKFNVAFKDPAEEAHRMSVFAKNLDKIKELNEKKAGGEGVVYGVTAFAHLTSEEFLKQMLPATSTFNATLPAKLHKAKTHFNRSRAAPGIRGNRQKRQTYPTNFDWRTYNAITSVKHQGSCGCCWAFASVAAVEAQYAIWNGALLNLCEQEVLNCDSASSGCSGGYTHTALDWINTNGLHYETAAPYTQAKGTCSALSGSKISTDSNVEMWGWTEEEMKEYLYDYGPIAISFGMGADTQFYSSTSGIYQPASCVGINHAMLAVGYGVENGVPFWMVKNQWGTGWGYSGYMKIKRNVNMCHFADQNIAPYYAY